MELFELTAHELGDLIRKRQIDARELTESVLERLEAVEDRVRAYLTLTPELAREMAKASSESESPLAGIPVAVKDNFCTKGILTTCASKILHNFVPIYDATVVTRAKEAKLPFVGKTNMDEFAMGSSTENSGFRPTSNPWDLGRVPGGSSGGTAAAVAAGEAILGFGSDTGGSIRQPASFCGVVGLKPTYGRVSRYGLVAFASSLDQIGPITKDVTDCALLLNLISGHDRLDSTSADLPVPDFTQALNPSLDGLTIGVPAEFLGLGTEEEVKQSIGAAIKVLESAGAVCEETSLPHVEYALPCYYLIAPAEASSNLARYDGVKYGYRSPNAKNEVLDMYQTTRREGFGAEVKRRIMLGTYALSAGYYDAYYLKALKVRTLIKQDFDIAFQRFDALICPTSPTTAFRIGEKTDDPLQMYLSDVCTIPVNLAGIPAISIPCGFDRKGLPIGLQIMGKPFDESTLLRAAYGFEQRTDYHLRRPTL